MNSSAHLAPRYEALFRVSDCLRVHRDVESLFRVLPFQLRALLDFDYISVFIKNESGNGACWYVPGDGDQLVLTPTRSVPAQLPQLMWAFEHQQPALTQSGCAIPMTTADRQVGAIFLGSDCPAIPSEAEVRFLSFVADRVALAVDHVLKNESQADPDHLYEETIALREEIASTSMFEEIVGSSDALDRVLAQVTKVASAEATVLITGESGTGKELIARAIHNRSPRARRPFIGLNCAAIPPSLIASELFGCEKGAFTGATQRRVGRFELANGGTIFLDEIGDIPAETQIALLRVLQEREFERVGGTRPVPIDVRVLAATNRDLRAEVSAGRFRLDLFYRLNVFPIQVPPLRERREDILLLAKYFVGRYAGKAGKKIRNIERKTVELLEAYDWPGNIRELQNVVERAVILSDGETFSIEESWLRPETGAARCLGTGAPKSGKGKDRSRPGGEPRPHFRSVRCGWHARNTAHHSRIEN
jgi:transcriptional regulator with GAF, ATPase, and Fis domain